MFTERWQGLADAPTPPNGAARPSWRRRLSPEEGARAHQGAGQQGRGKDGDRALHS